MKERESPPHHRDPEQQISVMPDLVERRDSMTPGQAEQAAFWLPWSKTRYVTINHNHSRFH